MRRRRRSTRRIIFTVLLAALAIIAATRAAASQDIAKGESIARTSCAGCHSIEAGGPELGGGPPSFVSLARKPGTNKAALRIFLSTSHAKMANYALTQDEIADVSAYLLSLRK
jgi:cytochrome c